MYGILVGSLAVDSIALWTSLYLSGSECNATGVRRSYRIKDAENHERRQMQQTAELWTRLGCVRVCRCFVCSQIFHRSIDFVSERNAEQDCK